MKGVGNSTRVLEKAELLKSLGEYSGCIRTIESVPEEERSYRMTLLLGWAYSDLAVLGEETRTPAATSRIRSSSGRP